jgi:3-oxoacid CoA-transferase A subunit
LVGGFGMAGVPTTLIDALIDQGARDLTIVSNNAGNGDTGLAALLATGRVRKVICSVPRQSDSYVFDGLYRSGKVGLEVVPQGNLAERMRAGGRASARSTARQVSERCWPRARRSGASTAAIMCWSTRFGAMSH